MPTKPLKYFSRYRHLSIAERKSLLHRSNVELYAWVAVFFVLSSWIPNPWFDFEADHGELYKFVYQLLNLAIMFRILGLAMRTGDLRMSKPWQEPTESPRNDPGDSAV
jgi:hypothetical protein